MPAGRMPLIAATLGVNVGANNGLAASKGTRWRGHDEEERVSRTGNRSIRRPISQEGPLCTVCRGGFNCCAGMGAKLACPAKPSTG